MMQRVVPVLLLRKGKGVLVVHVVLMFLYLSCLCNYVFLNSAKINNCWLEIDTDPHRSERCCEVGAAAENPLLFLGEGWGEAFHKPFFLQVQPFQGGAAEYAFFGSQIVRYGFDEFARLQLAERKKIVCAEGDTAGSCQVYQIIQRQRIMHQRIKVKFAEVIARIYLVFTAHRSGHLAGNRCV